MLIMCVNGFFFFFFASVFYLKEINQDKQIVFHNHPNKKLRSKCLTKKKAIDNIKTPIEHSPIFRFFFDSHQLISRCSLKSNQIV